MEETPPVSSSALLPSASSVEDKPFLLDEASPVGCSELEPAANFKPELELDAPAPNFKNVWLENLFAVLSILLYSQASYYKLRQKG